MEPELITLTQVIQDVKEIDKIFTDYSRTFNLPASKKNNILFKRWYNPDIVGFDNQIMANARIELNHLAFKEGKIKLESVTMKHNQPSLYKVTFFGNTVSLSNLIGEEQLDNLSWLNNFNFDSSDSNILTALNTGLNKTVDSVSYTDAVIYPLLTHSQSYIYDTGGDYSNPVNVSASGSNLTQRGVLSEDLKPAIKVSLIIKAIEQQYNLTFKTGGFFDSAAMTNLYLWLHRDKGKIDYKKFKIVDDQAFSCATASSSIASIPFLFPSSGSCTYLTGTNTTKFDNGTYEFVGSNDGDYFTNPATPIWGYKTTVTPTSATVLYTIQIINVEKNEVVTELKGCLGARSLTAIFYTNGFLSGATDAGYFTLELGEKVKLATKIIHTGTLTFGIVNQAEASIFPSSGPIMYSGVFTSSSTTIATGGDVEISEQMPEMKVLDFLRGLFKMHNLTAFVDLTGQIVVKTLDSFYSGGDSLDLNKYINTDTHSVANTLPFTEIDFEYSEAKSILAQQFELTNNRKFGEVEFISDASKGETFKIEAPFEHMLFERLNDINTGGTISQTDIQYGAFLDDDLNPSIGAPLLFYGIYRENVSTPINFVEGTTRTTDGTLPTAGTTNSSLDDYWMPHNANELGTTTTAPTYNLNFGSEINSYTLTDYSGINNSLFQLYYQNYITRVFNKRTRLFNYKAILPLNILLKLSLDDTIIIQERAFTINKMTTKLQSGETEFELLNEPT